MRWERQHVDPVRPAEAHGLQRDVARVIVHQKEDGVVLACRRVADDVWQGISGEYLCQSSSLSQSSASEFPVKHPGPVDRRGHADAGTAGRAGWCSRRWRCSRPSSRLLITQFSPEFLDRVLAF